MKTNSLLSTAAIVAVAAASFGVFAPPANAEDRIRAIAAFTRQVGFTQSFLRFVEKANAGAKGTFQIQFVGGPEAVPTFEQAEAVRKGIADMGFTPSSYYQGAVPEVEGLVGGNVAPWEARANGGFDLLNQIQQRKLNSFILAWVEYGPRFNFYLKNQPKLRPDGLPDLSGVKLRGAPAYRDFMAAMNGTFVNIAAPEVFTALERGTVDGFAWPAVGVLDFGWEKFVKFKIMPEFFNIDIVINVNLDKWKAMSQATRDLLQKMAIEWERESYDYWIAQAKKEQDEIKKRGVQDFTLSAEAGRKYISLASETVWTRIKSRDPSNVDALRARLYKE